MGTSFSFQISCRIICINTNLQLKICKYQFKFQNAAVRETLRAFWNKLSKFIAQISAETLLRLPNLEARQVYGEP